MSRHRSLREQLPRILLTIATPLVMALFVVGSAEAQTPPPDSTRKITRDSAAGVLVETDTAHKAEFRRLLSAIESAQIPASIPDTAAKIAVLDVRPLVVDGNEAKLTSTLQRHEASVMALRDSLQRHNTVRTLLESHGIPISQVLAVDTSTNPGRATLYYWPRQ